MNLLSRITLGSALALCMAAAVAGEQGKKRELLHPPKTRYASPISDRLAVRGVFYMPSVQTDLRYDSSTGVPGTLLSGENTLLFQDKLKQGSADLTFRMLQKHRIRAEFYRMSRSGTQFLTQVIRFGDSVYNVNDQLTASMDLRKVDIVYTYSFLRREKFELAAGLALHLLQTEGILDVPGTPLRLPVHEKLDFAGPFATVAVDGTWRVTPRFSFNARGNYLGGHASDVNGSYRQWHADTQFRWRPNFAVGVGYTATRFHLDSANPDLLGLFTFDYRGPEAFLRVSY
jgi:hypothetical protein